MYQNVVQDLGVHFFLLYFHLPVSLSAMNMGIAFIRENIHFKMCQQEANIHTQQWLKM